MLKFFAEKMWVAFAVFLAKNIRILCIEPAKTVNEMTLNKLVKLTTLWITGPRYLANNNIIYGSLFLFQTANVATSSSIEDPLVSQEVVKPKISSPSPSTARPPSVTQEGKGRKQLPSIPDAETEAAMSAAVNNKQNSMMTGGSGYGPFLLEYSLMAE